MKKMIVALVMFSLVGVGIVSFAAPTANLGIQITVPQELELASWIRFSPPGITPYGSGSGDATSLDFGTLTKDPVNGIWVPDKYFTVFFIGSSSGRPYRIVQTNTGITLGSTDLNNSLIMSPDYQSADEMVLGTPQGSMPAGDTVGSHTLSVGANKVVYNGNAGLSRIVRAYYGLSNGDGSGPAGAQPITGDQLSGTYSGTITFSVVLQ